ncbi:hypothetical protein DFJ74DRAFT_656900 [Hyaloraphidium curvatum]|nr:hypothetical protein DFJ74DRAFT_656900 [Hyaloraphidium curvatum]
MLLLYSPLRDVLERGKVVVLLLLALLVCPGPLHVETLSRVSAAVPLHVRHFAVRRRRQWLRGRGGEGCSA